MAGDKPWWRTWTGYPEWARDLVAWDRDVIVADPQDREWEVEARPTGVWIPDGPTLPFWPLAWLVHVLIYRAKWNIWIGPWKSKPPWKPKKWLYQRYRSMDEAKAAMPIVIKQIETGTWQPRDE